jgi:hypothetical protein
MLMSHGMQEWAMIPNPTTLLAHTKNRSLVEINHMTEINTDGEDPG